MEFFLECFKGIDTDRVLRVKLRLTRQESQRKFAGSISPLPARMFAVLLGVEIVGLKGILKKLHRTAQPLRVVFL